MTTPVLAANTAEEIASRIASVRSAMKLREIDLLYVTYSTDLEYLSGVERPVPSYGRERFWSDWALGALIGQDGDPVLLAPRHLAVYHLNELGAEMHGVDMEIINETDDPLDSVVRAVKKQGSGSLRRIGLNVDAPCRLVLNLVRAFPNAQVIDAGDLLAELRAVKSPAELDAMTSACELVDTAYREVLEHLTPTTLEIDLVALIDQRLVALGAIQPSFKTGIWTMSPLDTRGSKDRLSRRAIGNNTSVNFDFGAGLRGYCSDFGRTVFMGKPSERYRRAYEAVVTAQAEAARVLKPGTPALEVDRVAHQVIREAGFEDFAHRVGHGIGKDTHEPPYLDIVDSTPLKPGMTFTIEPDIFLPGEFGVRLEDVFVVSADGGRRLNRMDTELRAI
jgi:Xaa-Pro aminopeptidase